MRRSNLELLRITSMILILMSHCDDIFGIYDLYSTSLGTAKLITDWLHMGGQIGVGCFVLISGYFMVEQEISSKKILKLACEVWFYTIGIWLVWTVYNVFQGQFTMKTFLVEVVYAFFPIVTGQYWFATAYLVLMLLSPFLNVFIFALDYLGYRRFLTTIILIFVILRGGYPVYFRSWKMED